MIRRSHQNGSTLSEALYSDCETYRYALTREWDAAGPRLLYIMLNPSTATEAQNDQTVERCERRAKALGHGAFRVVNLFAFRATAPADLRRAAAPVGPENDRVIEGSLTEWSPSLILCAWGLHGAHLGRSEFWRRKLQVCGLPIAHLGLTKAGEPRHPLYVSYEIQPQLWVWGLAKAGGCRDTLTKEAMMSATVIPGFARHRIALHDTTLSVQIAGEGPALILLHGYPENGMCWSRVAGAFTKSHRVIIPDLRGYGESDAPADDPAHRTYSKRRMAQDIVELLDALGLADAMVLGHDRGARVAYRLALDHPARVSRLGIIEIAPTADYWANWGAELAMAAYHWTFLAQPAPLPERMIGADPVAYLDWTLTSWTKAKSLSAFPPENLASYRQQISDPAHLHAMCADYRAGATADRADDEADLAEGRKIIAPLRFLYGHHGFPARTGDPEGIWRKWAHDVTASPCDSGHFVMEENSEAVVQAFVPFFAT